MTEAEYDQYSASTLDEYGGDEVPEDYEPALCSNCSGSGEGQYEGTTCRVCNGKGEV